MRRLTNLTDDAFQQHVVLFEESEIAINLRYHPTAQFWTIDVSYGSTRILGHKLSVNVLHMRSRNLPFDFVVRDTTGYGLDPYRRDDWVSGRCELYLLDPNNMEEIRGAPVPL